jgi:hypothetical protein
MVRGRQAGWPLFAYAGRGKSELLRAKVLGNTQAGQLDGKCHRNIPPSIEGKGEIGR